MAKIDLSGFDKAELLQLQKDVAKELKGYDERQRKEARAKLEEQAAALGFSLDELTGRRASKKVNPPKYAHPENPTMTWSGRGRQPAWIKEHLEAGKPLDDLLIKK
jgi:DNA-binding protein H-NS